MTTFIFDVLKDLQDNNKNLSELTFVLPSKRAGLFLKHQLHKVCKQTIFAPEIISIEEFVEELSGLKTVSNTELLFEFYNTYLELTPKEEADSFEVFTKWAQILLQDFNEIDRYRIPQKKIFDYLSDIKEIEHHHWSLEENQTDFIKNYLAFWNKLHSYYNNFSKQLKLKQIGYQGLLYREAADSISKYIEENPAKQHLFLGFNALNTCEETIIQALLKQNLADIYWDIDAEFFNNTYHDASLFTRQHRKNWPHFKEHDFKWITQNYTENKNISTFGIPKNIGQAKYIGSLLKDLQRNNPNLENTAVVLGDEDLLIPVLNSIPDGINALNITMGFPLKSIPLAWLFESLFYIHKTPSKSFYYKDVINIISHQFIRPLFYVDDVDYASKLIETIDGNNIIYLTAERLKAITPKSGELIDLLFSNWNKSIYLALKNCSSLIVIIKKYLDQNKDSNLLALEYLYRFNELFNELNNLNSKYEHITDISTLFGIYKELLSSETLDFQGEPLQGLQVMGMLESRVLDFETVIISSVNEGVLPSGKSNNSFIPFDLKIENKLPTYKEKDAVYTYHFYRLLQRAKNVYILYNTEADVLTGGEKSRFITQLELENNHNINHQILAPKVPVLKLTEHTVEKTEQLVNEIKAVAEKGFSPSSLTSYIRNPIDFYYQKILKIKEHDDVEETVAANTLGTVVHNTLEDFYKPLEGSFISVEIIKNLKTRIDERVTFHFKNEYKEGDITKGKNLIIYEIAKRYVSNFLDFEIKDLKAGNEIKIIAIEADNKVEITDIPKLDFPVKLVGKVDRVDQYNGITRIIDYKTGRVDQNQVEIVNWEDLTTDYKKYSKSFQVLTYAYMMQLMNQINLPVEAGIISFKNLSAGVLKFAKKDKSGYGAKKEVLITQETIDNFKIELKNLILEICNPNIPFTEKDV
ncbi:PD-(D/E)XK nuclease family protein [Aestuariibaculum lutulentum]|uniref:PD-(D/E)XK nuclease family protein n=1 Tax=Aestuariibaculum lutulentum TaxID=2920935 RepID=A0ABS9RH50_9FLAO|nr:PD-(D/E)XK nuclease family protein [Aestuariibaculum lutulentum]MCH4552280.1 PD-(D/E)XK nuclease family protein [Aestuariibaculum lutulentum]